jgi:hypothetical protein
MTRKQSATVDPELTLQLAGESNTPLQAIVTSKNGLEALLDKLPPEIHVDHAYSLTASVCVTARPSDLRRLVDMPMVKSIEPLRSVHHW